ncbi:hypothetical protein Q8F55_008560 [Vanrija albida]|uniref:Zn(2)-C6 fungal-type domain-containing protein n=1 Tax=Vanrija albida TaxID=181172 RepID=A0ABR3PR65_9TREE
MSSVASTTAPPARKRKRRTRTKTGCRECRRQHVKCNEGAILASGRKVACRRCWETDQACFYPFPANGYPASSNGKRRTGAAAGGEKEPIPDITWEQAQDVAEWVGKDDDEASASPPVVPPAASMALPLSMALFAPSSELFDPAVHLPPARPRSNRAVSPLTPLAALEPLPQWNNPQWTNVRPASIAPPRAVHPLLPPKSIANYTLASLSTTEADRATVAYFELQGCNEVTCVASHRENWIFTQLFPRLFQTLASPAPSPAGTPTTPGDTAAASPLRAWLHHSLLHLAYVHRGNVERDAVQGAYLRSEGRAHRDKATCALFKAKVLGAEFRSDEYLGRVSVDATAILALKSAASSPFHDTLRDLINVYASIQAACAPSPAADALPVLEVGDSAPAEWTERTFGCSRATVRLMARVSGMVARRSVLLQSAADSSAPALLLKAEAEALANELGDAWDWDERNVSPGSSDRIMRYALRTMLLTEILDTPLSDPRLSAARQRACELVADCDPSLMAGFQWEMTVLAVYTADAAARVRIRALIRLALDSSFGPQYTGALDVLDVCWDVLDARGAYEHGVAPWREAMAALGRNLWF